MQLFLKSRPYLPVLGRTKRCLTHMWILGFLWVLSTRSRACWARLNWKVGDLLWWHLASHCPALSLMNSLLGLAASSLADSSLASSLLYVFWFFLWLFSSLLGSVVEGLWPFPTTLSKDDQVINAQPPAAYPLHPVAIEDPKAWPRHVRHCDART